MMLRGLFIVLLASLITLGGHTQSIPGFKKQLFVSHLSGTNKTMLRRAGAPKHNAIGKVICFKYKCCMVVGWRHTQQRNKFKGYKKGPGIPRLKYLKNDSLKRIDNDIENDLKPVPRDSIASSVTPPVRNDSIVAIVFDDVLFDTNSSHLKSEFMRQLDTLSDRLRKYSNYEIRIVGHTDNSGAEKDNVRLSKHRAESVASYLASTGIDPGVITAEGMGSDVPIERNNTVEGRRKNRRVEVVLSFR
jgi:outer membrane protein OmpA-like peptidoglycan-associated protein